MKKVVIFLWLVLGILPMLQAQDIIIRKDGTEVQAKVLEVNPKEIKYKRFDNQEGPVYSEEKNRIRKIKYKNGTEDVLVKDSSLPEQDAIVWQPMPQEKKVKRVSYSGLVEVAPFVGDCSEESGFGGVAITTTHGIQIVDKYFVGLGVGVNVSSLNETYVPVYATFRLDLSRARTRPFFSCSLGAQFGNFRYNNDDYYEHMSRWDVGLWTNAMFGYRFANKLYVAGGITVQSAYRYTYVSFYDSRGNYDYDDIYSQKVYGAVALMVAFGIRF